MTPEVERLAVAAMRAARWVPEGVLVRGCTRDTRSAVVAEVLAAVSACEAQPKASASPCPGCEGGWGFADNAHTRDNRCQYDTQPKASEQGESRG